MVSEVGLKRIALSVVKKILPEYSIYKIFKYDLLGDQQNSFVRSDEFVFKEVDSNDVQAALIEKIRGQAWYGGKGAVGFACIHSKTIVALCWYWHGERYKERNYWPLKKGEAKLVQIITAPDYRGLGIASQLIGYSAAEMRNRGFNTLFARIWHSNYPSIRSFQKAGWQYVTTIVELDGIAGKVIRLSTNQKKLKATKLELRDKVTS